MILELSLLAMLLSGALLFGMLPGLIMLVAVFIWAASQYAPLSVGAALLVGSAVAAVPLCAAVCGIALERHTFAYTRCSGRLSALVLGIAIAAYFQARLPVAFFAVVERTLQRGAVLHYGGAILAILSAALSVGTFAALLIMAVVLLAEAPLLAAGRIGAFKSDRHVAVFRPLLTVFVLSLAMNFLLALCFEELSPIGLMRGLGQP